MTDKNDKPVVNFRVLQSVEDYIEKSGKFRTECTSFKIPGQDSGSAKAVYFPYCEKQRFDFGPMLNDYRGHGVFTPPEFGKPYQMTDFVLFREHFHDIHCPQPCRGYSDKRIVAPEKPAPQVPKQTADSSAGKWTKKEIVAAVVVPVVVVLIGSVLAWMTPEGRRWLHLDKLQEQQAPIQSVPAPKPHIDSTTPQSKAEQVPAEKHGTTEVLPPTTDKVDVIVKRAPSQTATATVGHPKKKLRTKIGDLITEGTKIRDIAPVYVGTPTHLDGEPDVIAEWTAWSRKVEQFLNANFDSAEVAKFRSRDDPNTSLNSKIHWEIAYLEQLLDRVGQDSQVPTMNSAPGGIVNNGGVINNPTINNAPPSRTIDPKTTEIMKAVLEKHKAKVRVYAVNYDKEANEFAQRLYDLLVSAGWEMKDAQVISVVLEKPWNGVRVGYRGIPPPNENGLVSTPNDTPQAALIGCLMAAKITGLTVNLKPELEEGYIELLVSSNPPPRN